MTHTTKTVLGGVEKATPNTVAEAVYSYIGHKFPIMWFGDGHIEIDESLTVEELQALKDICVSYGWLS